MSVEEIIRKLPDLAPDAETVFFMFQEAYTSKVLIPIVLRRLGKALSGDISFLKIALTDLKS